MTDFNEGFEGVPEVLFEVLEEHGPQVPVFDVVVEGFVDHRLEFQQVLVFM